MLDPKTFSVSLPPFPLCFFPRQKVKKKRKVVVVMAVARKRENKR